MTMPSKERELLQQLCDISKKKLTELQTALHASSNGFFNTFKIKRMLARIISEVNSLEKALKKANGSAAPSKKAVMTLFKSVLAFAPTATQFKASYPTMIPIQTCLQSLIQDTLARTPSMIENPSDFNTFSDALSQKAINEIFMVRKELDETLKIDKIQVRSQFNHYTSVIQKAADFADSTLIALQKAFEENEHSLAIKKHAITSLENRIRELRQPLTALHNSIKNLQSEYEKAVIVVHSWEEKEHCECWDLGYKCHGHPMITRKQTAPDHDKRQRINQQIEAINQSINLCRQEIERETMPIQQDIAKVQQEAQEINDTSIAITEGIKFIQLLQKDCQLMRSAPKRSLSDLATRIQSNYPKLAKLFSVLSAIGMNHQMIFQLLTLFERSPHKWLKLQDAMEDKNLLPLSLLGEAVDIHTNRTLIEHYHYYLLVLLSTNSSNILNKQQIARCALGDRGDMTMTESYDDLYTQIESMYPLFAESISNVQLQNKLIRALDAAQACHETASLHDRISTFRQTLDATSNVAESNASSTLANLSRCS